MKRLGDWLVRSVGFWIFLGISMWAFTFSWGWHQNQLRDQADKRIAHEASVENCRSLNELKRDIYITLADFDVPMAQRIQFLPTRNCERLP